MGILDLHDRQRRDWLHGLARHGGEGRAWLVIRLCRQLGPSPRRLRRQLRAQLVSAAHAAR